MNSLNQISSTCKDRRLFLNLTQKQLSELTGIKQAEISKFESGKKDLFVGTLVRITDALGLQIELKIIEK